MTSKIIECRLCGTSLPEHPALRLDRVPQKVQFFPQTDEELRADTPASLEVYECVGCGLVQLSSPPVVYATYGETSTSSYSPQMMAYRKQQMADFIAQYHLEGKKLVDVGCGDGFMLGILDEFEVDAVGIDAASEAIEIARSRGYTAHVGYFNKESKVEGYPFDAFVSFDVLEHVPDLKSFLQGISANLTDGAVGLIETHNVDNLLERHRFYDFVLDHLSYFTVDTFRLSLELSGFDVLHMEINRNGENLTAIVRKRSKKDIPGLAAHVDELKTTLDDFISRYTSQGKSLAIWGASFQALTLFAMLDTSGVQFVIDSAPYKQGKFAPVSHLRIVSPDVLKAEPVDVILVVAARYNDEIIRQILTKEQFNGTLASLNGVTIQVVQEG